MNKIKSTIIIGIFACLLVSGCARTGKVADDSPTSLQPKGMPMTTYNREWIMKNAPGEESVIESWYFYADYIQSTPEFKENAHKSSEYWDEDGNFINPSKTAMDTEWKNIPGKYKTEDVIDAVIPQDVMDKMSTRELLDVATEEKAVIGNVNCEMYYLRNYLVGLGSSVAYREFMSRDDFAQTLYDYYMSINPAEYIGDDFKEEYSDNIFYSKSYVRVCGIFFNEVTMATDDFYDGLTEQERENVVNKSVEISDYIRKHDTTGNLYQISWASHSESGYSAFDDTVRNYDISPKWKEYIKDADKKSDSKTEEPQNETLEIRNEEPYYSNIDDWYDSEGNIVMPIVQDRKLWLDSAEYLDRIKLCALPDELLKSASTADLVILMTQCPRNYYMNMYGDVEEGMKEVEAGFNGLRELLNREDCAEEVLNFYRNYQIPQKKFFDEKAAADAGLTDMEEILKNATYNEQINEDAKVGYALNTCEWVLTRAKIVNKLDDDRLKEIVSVMQEKNAMLQKTEYAGSIENYLLKAAAERKLPCVYRYGIKNSSEE